MVAKIKFSGGDNLTSLEKKVHQTFMVTELNNGYGAYELSYAEAYEGGNSSLSFGGNQMDLSIEDKEVKRLFIDIIKHALDSSGTNILTSDEIKRVIKINYAQKGLKSTTIFGPELLPKINAALSSEDGINKINEAYAQELRQRIANVEKAIDSLTHEKNREILKNSEKWKLRLIDYHNQFGLTIKDEQGNLGQMMRFLNGEEVILRNKLYNDQGIVQNEQGNPIIKATHLVKISGELDLGDFKNFIKATDE